MALFPLVKFLPERIQILPHLIYKKEIFIRMNGMNSTNSDASDVISNFLFGNICFVGYRCIPSVKNLWQRDNTSKKDGDVHLNNLASAGVIKSMPENEAIVLIALLCTSPESHSKTMDWQGLAINLKSGKPIRFSWCDACDKFKNFYCKHKKNMFSVKEQALEHASTHWLHWLLPPSICIYRSGAELTIYLWLEWQQKMSISNQNMSIAFGNKRKSSDFLLAESNKKKKKAEVILPSKLLQVLSTKDMIQTKARCALSKKALERATLSLKSKNAFEFVSLAATDNLHMATFSNDGNTSSAQVAAAHELERAFPVKETVSMSSLTSLWNKSYNDAEVLNFLQRVDCRIGWQKDVVQHRRVASRLDLDHLCFEMKGICEKRMSALQDLFREKNAISDIELQAVALVDFFEKEIRADADRLTSVTFGFQRPSTKRPTIGHYKKCAVFAFSMISLEPCQIWFIDPPMKLMVNALAVVSIALLNFLQPDGSHTKLVNSTRDNPDRHTLLQHTTVRVGGGPWLYRLMAIICFGSSSEPLFFGSSSEPTDFRYVEETYNGKERSYGRSEYDGTIPVRDKLVQGLLDKTGSINVYSDMLHFATSNVFEGTLTISIGVQNKFHSSDGAILFPVYKCPLSNGKHYYTPYSFGNLPWSMTGGTYNVRSDPALPPDLTDNREVRTQIYAACMRWALGKGPNPKENALTNALGLNYFVNNGSDTRVDSIDIQKVLDGLSTYAKFSVANLKVFAEEAGIIRVERAFAFQIGNGRIKSPHCLLAAALGNAFTSTLNDVTCIRMDVITAYIRHTHNTMIALYRHSLQTLLDLSKANTQTHNAYDILNVFSLLRHVGLGLESFYGDKEITPQQMQSIDVKTSMRLDRGAFGVILGIPDVVRHFLSKKMCVIDAGPSELLVTVPQLKPMNINVHPKMSKSGSSTSKVVFCCNFVGCGFRCVSAGGFFQGHLMPLGHSSTEPYKEMNLKDNAMLYTSMCAGIDDKCGDYDVLTDALKRFRSGESICIQGNAGTGKSYAISILAQQADLMYQKAEVAYVAPNGMACFNLDFRAKTIHNLLGYTTPYIDDLPDDAVANILTVDGKFEELKKIKVIFLDEVGAISSVYGIIMDKVFQAVHSTDRYMGGVQVIAAGQLLQLSGIIDKQHMSFVNGLGVDAMGLLPEFTANLIPIYLVRIFRTVNEEFQNMQICARNGLIDDQKLSLVHHYGEKVRVLEANAILTPAGYMNYLKLVGRVYYFWKSIILELRKENVRLKATCIEYIVSVKGATTQKTADAFLFSAVSDEMITRYEAQIRKCVNRDDELVFFHQREFLIQSQAGKAINMKDKKYRDFVKFRKGVRVLIKEIITVPVVYKGAESAMCSIGWDEDGFRTVNNVRDELNKFAFLHIDCIDHIVVAVEVKIMGKIQHIEQIMEPTTMTHGRWRRRQLPLLPASLLPAMQMQGMTLGMLNIRMKDFVEVQDMFSEAQRNSCTGDSFVDGDHEIQGVEGLWYMMITRVTTPEDIYFDFSDVCAHDGTTVLYFANSINRLKRLAEDDFQKRSNLRNTLSTLRFLSFTAMNNVKAAQYRKLTQDYGSNLRKYKSLISVYTVSLKGLLLVKNLFGLAAAFTELGITRLNIVKTAALLTIETSFKFNEVHGMLEKAFAFCCSQIRKENKTDCHLDKLKSFCQALIDGSVIESYWEIIDPSDSVVSEMTEGPQKAKDYIGQNEHRSPRSQFIVNPGIPIPQALPPRNGILTSDLAHNNMPNSAKRLPQSQQSQSNVNNDRQAIHPHNDLPSCTQTRGNESIHTQPTMPIPSTNVTHAGKNSSNPVPKGTLICTSAAYSVAELNSFIQGTNITVRECVNFITTCKDKNVSRRAALQGLGELIDNSTKLIEYNGIQCFCGLGTAIKVNLFGYYCCTAEGRYRCYLSINRKHNSKYPKCSACLDAWLEKHLNNVFDGAGTLMKCVGHIRTFNRCPHNVVNQQQYQHK
jgi:hypothetical protein